MKLLLSISMILALSFGSNTVSGQYANHLLDTEFNTAISHSLSPAILLPIEQEKVAAQRTSRRKATVVFWMLSGVATRAASRSAYSKYLVAATSQEAEQRYIAANTLHQLSFGCFGVASIQWVGQLTGKRKKS